VPTDVHNLIQKMSSANPRWCAPRIHGELQKLGIHLAQATVAKYMVRHRKPPSQTWRTFLQNHAKELVSTDFFVVPTATFRLLFVFLVLSHDRRRLLHFGVTSHPTAEWTTQQFREFLADLHPYRFVIHDRDSIFSPSLDGTLNDFGVRVIRTPVQAPTANAFCERLIGTIRRECLDYLIPLSERHLRLTLREFVAFYNRGRPHSALGPGTTGYFEPLATPVVIG